MRVPWFNAEETEEGGKAEEGAHAEHQRTRGGREKRRWGCGVPWFNAEETEEEEEEREEDRKAEEGAHAEDQRTRGPEEEGRRGKEDVGRKSREARGETERRAHAERQSSRGAEGGTSPGRAMARGVRVVAGRTWALWCEWSVIRACWVGFRLHRTTLPEDRKSCGTGRGEPASLKSRVARGRRDMRAHAERQSSKVAEGGRQFARKGDGAWGAGGCGPHVNVVE